MTDAFHSIAARSSVPLFMFGDHSSDHIPNEFEGLGLSAQDRARHIAVDIGTEGVIRGLCHDFGCAGHLAGVSRLVIDCNRDLAAEGLIASESDGSLISGNQNLSKTQRQIRIDKFYTPYHDALSDAIESCSKSTSDPLIISIHSFTPQLRGGDKRPVEIGFLVKADPNSARAAMAEFSTISMNYNVGYNEPYSAWDLNHTVDVHVTASGLRHLNIEIRQDLITTARQQAHMADILSRIIGPVMRRQPVAPRPY